MLPVGAGGQKGIRGCGIVVCLAAPKPLPPFVSLGQMGQKLSPLFKGHSQEHVSPALHSNSYHAELLANRQDHRLYEPMAVDVWATGIWLVGLLLMLFESLAMTFLAFVFGGGGNS